MIVGSIFLIGIVAILLSWPTPKYATKGIPHSIRNHETMPARYNVAGDHLQLMYHFDLVHDMIKGQIPWFHNPFEFNVDGDATTYRPGAYFLPLSAAYAFFRMLLNQALAYNLTWFFSLWLTAMFSWAWLSAFSKDQNAVFMGVFVILLIPFRWFSIFGGSPSGMAMCWVPLIAWQLDRAIRNPGWLSGAKVGLGLMFAFWGDLHVFYFSALALPAFAGLSALSILEQGQSLPWRKWIRILPSGLVSLGLMIAYHIWRKHMLGASMMRDGRTLREVAAFSPRPIGLLGLGRPLDNTVFIGLVITVMLIALSIYSICKMISQIKKPITQYRFAMLFLLWLAMLATIALALGTNSLGGDRLIRIVRARIPYFPMIRQPFKIYAIMPIWLGLLATMCGTVLPKRLWVRASLSALLACAMLYEMHAHCNVAVSLLRPPQGAYKAVQLDAAAQGHIPARAIVVPLWPGESADTSVPILHAHHYGIRLINGYSPVVSRTYFDDVFRRLESINQGWLRDDQIDFLMEREIRYILLHENQFPEKVSPHPVALTRDLLLAHPRLSFLHQDGVVWAFRIEPHASTDRPAHRDVTRFPSRLWSFAAQGKAEFIETDPTTHTGRLLQLTPVNPRTQSPTWRMPLAFERNWLLRGRGNATLEIQTMLHEEIIETVTLRIQQTDWQWIKHPLPLLPDFGPVQINLVLTEGTFELDIGLLTMGTWPGLDIQTPLWAVRAADFFRAGISEIENHTVRFRPDHDPQGRIFYGGRLPLSAGSYEVTLHASSSAPLGTLVGEWTITRLRGVAPQTQEVRVGDPMRMRWDQTDDVLVEVSFSYNRAADILLEEVVFKRLPDEYSTQP